MMNPSPFPPMSVRFQGSNLLYTFHAPLNARPYLPTAPCAAGHGRNRCDCSENNIAIKDTFRFDMVFPLYFPTISTLANVRAAEFMQ